MSSPGKIHTQLFRGRKTRTPCELKCMGYVITDAKLAPCGHSRSLSSVALTRHVTLGVSIVAVAQGVGGVPPPNTSDALLGLKPETRHSYAA